MEYYVEVMDIKGSYNNNNSIGWYFKNYEKAQEAARSIRSSLISNAKKGFLVMVKNELDQVLSFKVLN